MSRRRRSSLPTSAWAAIVATFLTFALLLNRGPAPVVITAAILTGIITEFVGLYIGYRVQVLHTRYRAHIRRKAATRRAR